MNIKASYIGNNKIFLYQRNKEYLDARKRIIRRETDSAIYRYLRVKRCVPARKFADGAAHNWV